MGISESIAGATALGAGFLTWAVRGRASSLFAPSVWRGPRDDASIALTFDDGPSESTPALLEVLAQYSVPATFFQCGANVRRVPDIARAVAAAGHEIGNHSDTHPLLAFRSAAFMRGEFQRAQETIRHATGTTPRWLRAPFGVRWPGLGAAQRELGLTGVMWSVIGRDWKWDGPRVAARCMNALENGAVICLHDGRELNAKPDIAATVEAVRRLVPAALERGYRFKTVSGLFRS